MELGRFENLGHPSLGTIPVGVMRPVGKTGRSWRRCGPVPAARKPWRPSERGKKSEKW